MTTLKTLDELEQELISRVEEPFVEPVSGITVIDMTDHVDVEGKVLRVELRRTRNPAIGKPSYKKKLVDPTFVIGLISPDALPKEGEEFQMPYHIINHTQDYGKVNSHEPVFDVNEFEDCLYFATSEGEWRLKVLDIGN